MKCYYKILMSILFLFPASVLAHGFDFYKSISLGSVKKTNNSGVYLDANLSFSMLDLGVQFYQIESELSYNAKLGLLLPANNKNLFPINVSTGNDGTSFNIGYRYYFIGNITQNGSYFFNLGYSINSKGSDNSNTILGIGYQF